MPFIKTIIFLINFILLSFIQFAQADTKLLMLTDKKCIYCMVWEKQIGKIYPKTEIANKFPLFRIEIKDFVNYFKIDLKKTKITPTFIFIENNKEKGRIIGYTNPEMFWWQVDEIVGD